MAPYRLRVLYLVPGHHLLPSAGPSRNALNLARGLSRFAEVTLAFRRILERPAEEPCPLLELDPACPLPDRPRDDAATRGIGALALCAYLRRLDAFAACHFAAFDLVLEKSWLFSGRLALRAQRQGALGVAVENFLPDPRRHGRGLLKRLRLALAARSMGHNLRRLPLVIAETETLKRALVARFGLAPERVAVVPLGIDRRLFRPRPKQEARAALGLAPAARILLYVGVLDRTHDLMPLFEALSALRGRLPEGLVLHLLGDGEREAHYRAYAAEHRLPVRFHGRVPHERVPLWIAAADLCLAPYDPAVFAGGELAYATMKIPEYLAVGRPVAAVASGRARELVRDGINGFLIPPTAAAWRRLLADFPPPARLEAMAAAAARTPLWDWEDTARAYLDACLKVRTPVGRS